MGGPRILNTSQGLPSTEVRTRLYIPKFLDRGWNPSTVGIGGISEFIVERIRLVTINCILTRGALFDDHEHEYDKGMIFYGPPGIGKLMLAEKIGKMLTRNLKTVDCLTIESMDDIENLFADAKREQLRKGFNSGLHVIILDNLDTICPIGGSSRFHVTITNKLRWKLESLNNVLVIGVAERLHSIDENLLRASLLYRHIKMGLPNQQGRLQIFKIRTKEMRWNNFFDPSVNLKELADISRNWTGADIADVVRAARYRAESRVFKLATNIETTCEFVSKIKVTQEDFLYAMEHDVEPQFGVAHRVKELAKLIREGDSEITKIQSDISSLARWISKPETKQERPYYILLLGDSGSDITGLAANSALETKFPFIRVYEAEATAGQSESAKISYMQKLFDDAGESELSCIVIDDLELIIDYSHIGPKFSIKSLAVFTTTRKKILPEGHRMLVICTCKSRQFLEDLRLEGGFSNIIEVPTLK